MQFSRILTHGQITSLTSGFSLNGEPFSIYVRPKGTVTAVDGIVNAKCIGDKTLAPLPVPFNDWTPASIIELGADAISLSSYDVYWGAGKLNP